MSPRSTPDAPRKREADPRVQRYRAAKGAARDWADALAAVLRAQQRADTAKAKFDAAVNAAEGKAESDYLMSLAPNIGVGSGEPTA